ncbi:MAG TPA: ABC transporter permease [Spirochaetota bacterium]|nr:ABC transporter permease [Spirochaetota bacterium]
MKIILILLKSPKFLTGIVILSIIFAITFLTPLVNDNSPTEMVTCSFQAPDSKHILGSDNFGRDVMIQLALGTQTSLYVGIIAGMVATLIGLFIGLYSGYLGGLIDNILTMLTNLFIVIPPFIILILISVSVDSRSSTLTALIIGFTSWPWTARAVRAQTSSLRNRDHINIAKLSGAGTFRIIIFEILPYIASYAVMAFILQTASGILAEAAISMLGLGPYNTISLGIMLNWAIVFEAPAAGAWWAFIPTAMIISAITFSLFYINSGMDEIFNPKIRS